MRKRIAGKVANVFTDAPVLQFLLGFVLVLGIIWGSFGIYTLGVNFYYKTQPRENFFDYQKVEYVKRDGNSLVFASTRIVKHQARIAWNDILHCNNGERYTFFSNYETSTNLEKLATDYKTVEWDYQKPFPVGRECYLESQITMTVHGNPKTQRVESEKFTIE